MMHLHEAVFISHCSLYCERAPHQKAKAATVSGCTATCRPLQPISLPSSTAVLWVLLNSGIRHTSSMRHVPMGCCGMCCCGTCPDVGMSHVLMWGCSVEETASGAVHLHMRPCTGGNRSSNPREGSIVVLTLSRPPPKGALDWAQGTRGRGHHGGKDTQGPTHKRQRFAFALPYLHFMQDSLIISLLPRHLKSPHITCKTSFYRCNIL